MKKQNNIRQAGLGIHVTLGVAFDEDGYTYVFQGLHLTRNAAVSQFQLMQRNGVIMDDSKYRVKCIPNLESPNYVLYIWA